MMTNYNSWFGNNDSKALKSNPAYHRNMERDREIDDRTAADDQPTFETYLPATAPVSTEPGRVERFLTRLFRRRGRIKADEIRTK